MLDLLVGILHLVVFPGGLFALALGLFLKGCDRRVEARLQRRVGPPLIQPFLDLIKLSTKEVIIPTSAVRGAFLAAPVVARGGIAMCAALLPVPGVTDGLPKMATCWSSSTCSPSRRWRSCWLAPRPARPTAASASPAR